MSETVPGGERKHTEKGGEEALEGIRLPGKGISCQVWSFPVLLWACVELAEEEEREEKEEEEEEEEEQKAQKEEKRRERRISGWPGFGYIRCRLEAGGWRLRAGGWRLEAGG